MTKTVKRTLAILLAACLLFGCALSAAAAEKTFGAKITISKMPDDKTFIPGITEPNLAGLELKFKLGGVEKTLVYDDMYLWLDDPEVDGGIVVVDGMPDMMPPDYTISLSYPDDGAKVGSNKFTLQVSVNFGDESYSTNNVPITLTGVTLAEKYDLAQAGKLTAGLPNKVEPTGAYNPLNDVSIYSFTPKVSGKYSFRSLSSQYALPSLSDLAGIPGIYWSALSDFFTYPSLYNFAQLFAYPGQAIAELFRSGKDPVAKLVDADGNWVANGDDNGVLGNTLNFNFAAQLEAGKTYYLLPSSYGTDAPYYVTPMFTPLAYIPPAMG